MTMETITWIGLGLSFLATFLFSLCHICLGSFSKISLSRFLEDEKKSYRSRILRDFDEIRVVVEYLRNVLLLVFSRGSASGPCGSFWPSSPAMPSSLITFPGS
jgi:hypothetical protein